MEFSTNRIRNFLPSITILVLLYSGIKCTLTSEIHSCIYRNFTLSSHTLSSEWRKAAVYGSLSTLLFHCEYQIQHVGHLSDLTGCQSLFFERFVLSRLFNLYLSDPRNRRKNWKMSWWCTVVSSLQQSRDMFSVYKTDIQIFNLRREPCTHSSLHGWWIVPPFLFKIFSDFRQASSKYQNLQAIGTFLTCSSVVSRHFSVGAASELSGAGRRYSVAVTQRRDELQHR